MLDVRCRGSLLSVVGALNLIVFLLVVGVRRCSLVSVVVVCLFLGVS